MPHIAVQMYSGRSDAEKHTLAARLTEAVTSVLGYGSEAVSVMIEDIPPSEWMERVYKHEITAHADRLFKRPGYGPLRQDTKESQQ